MASKYFAFWSMCYQKGWVTQEKLLQAKDAGIITLEEDETILAG
jgi:hypothetical protein